MPFKKLKTFGLNSATSDFQRKHVFDIHRHDELLLSSQAIYKRIESISIEYFDNSDWCNKKQRPIREKVKKKLSLLELKSPA